MARLQGTSKFKTAVLRMMSDQLDDNELKALERTFRAVDADNDGSLTFQEIKAALEKDQKGIGVKPEELQKLIKMADFTGDGVISLEELKMVCVNRKLIAKEERLWLAFCKLDLNGDGMITKDEIKKVIGDSKADADIIALIAEADTDGDGRINYDEFIAMWAKNQEKDGSESKSSDGDAIMNVSKEHVAVSSAVSQMNVSSNHPPAAQSGGAGHK
jgi:calcium-dependent protein kinase